MEPTTAALAIAASVTALVNFIKVQVKWVQGPVTLVLVFVLSLAMAFWQSLAGDLGAAWWWVGIQAGLISSGLWETLKRALAPKTGG